MLDIDILAIRLGLIALLLVLAIPQFRRKFYLYPLDGEALIRVGLGGLKILRGQEGGWFFSHFHILTRIPLSTFRLVATQRIITRDLREATIDVVFYLRILDHDEGIQAAAVSFTQDTAHPGSFAQPIRFVTPPSVGRLLEPRLGAYLRVGAASVTLEEMLSRSVHWLQEGQQVLSDDLYRQGLFIEDITLTRVSEG